MYFSVPKGLRLSAYAIALGSAVSACGGGGNGGDESGTSTAAVTSTATGASAASVAGSADSPVNTDIASAPVSSASSADSDTVASASTDTQASFTAMATATAPVGTTSAVSQTATIIASTQKARSGVGVNLANVATFSSQLPTIDVMKKSSPWITQCVGSTCLNLPAGATTYDSAEESKLNLDANGWVKSLPASTDTTVRYRAVLMSLAEAGVQQPGTYTVVYDGSGNISYGGAASRVANLSTPGRDIVNVTHNDTTAVFLKITATDPTNYLRNIRVYPPGGACANNLAVYAASASNCTAAQGKFVAFENFPAGYTWHPAFLASLKGFRSLRFMDWGKTNSTTVANWTDRAQPDTRTWSDPAGTPLEAMFDLASKVGADPWMNIPAHATDAYVHSFAQFAHTHLAAGSKLQLEYGNEMWNFGFAATKWGYAQAQTAFASQVAAGANTYLVYDSWYGMRLAQVCQIVKREFGADALRVQCIANTQAASSYNTDQVLQCTYAQGVLGKPCAKFIDAVAIAPYFGYYIGNGANTAIVSTWPSDPDGGLAKMFLEISGPPANQPGLATPLAALGAKSPQGAVAEVTTWMQSTMAVAAKYNLPMLAYEGGQSLYPPSDVNVMNLMFAANRDARMGAAYETMLHNWRSAGGQTFMLFNDVSLYAKSGMWGLRENMFDQTAAKWVAAVDWRDNISCWWSGC